MPTPAVDLGIDDDELAMVFIANELHRKGLGQTLEAMALNGDRRMSLHVVGKAELGPYQATIHRLGLDDRVRYHGPTVTSAGTWPPPTSWCYPHSTSRSAW